MTIQVTTNINGYKKKCYSIFLSGNRKVFISVFNNKEDRYKFTKDNTDQKDKQLHLLNTFSIVADERNIRNKHINIPINLLKYIIKNLNEDKLIVLNKCKHHYIDKLLMRYVDKINNNDCTSTYDY